MSEASLPKAVLLCIDDDQAVLECEKAFLENFGHTVVTASSGREGLKLAGLHSFDVVIVDNCMPEMNGQEFAIAMRRASSLEAWMSRTRLPRTLVEAFLPQPRVAS